ncbi:MAG: NAD(P)-dependent oxidoreductase [Chloroflexota bacterium]
MSNKLSNKLNVIIDPHFRKVDSIFSPADKERLYNLVDVVWGKDDPMPLDLATEALTQADAVVCANWRYGEALYHAPNLRAIMAVSGGFPLGFDYDYCFDKRIRVSTSAPAFGRQVAEMALGMALAAGREIALGDRAMRAGNETYKWQGCENMFMLFDKPVGFIGYGGLANALHPLLKPFGCKISAYDPWVSQGYLRRQGVDPVSLETLLETSKVIFVLAVPSSENRAMLSREQLERIQPDAALILMSRAHVVDFDALTDLLLAGCFRAAIDVFPQEPLDPNHPIRTAENAILSAHRAGSVPEGLYEIGEMVVDDLEALNLGVPPRRLQLAQPELMSRYESNKVKPYKNS